MLVKLTKTRVTKHDIAEMFENNDWFYHQNSPIIFCPINSKITFALLHSYNL